MYFNIILLSIPNTYFRSLFRSHFPTKLLYAYIYCIRVFNKSIHRSKPCLQSLKHVSMYFVVGFVLGPSRRSLRIGKVKLSLYRPWRLLGLREFEAPTFSDIRLRDGGKIVSPARRPLLTPRKIPGTHFC
jgi:hypothetical protein